MPGTILGAMIVANQFDNEVQSQHSLIQNPCFEHQLFFMDRAKFQLLKTKK